MNNIKKMLCSFLLLLIINQQAAAQEEIFLLHLDEVTHELTIKLSDALADTGHSYPQANITLDDDGWGFLGYAPGTPVFFHIAGYAVVRFRLYDSMMSISQRAPRAYRFTGCLSRDTTCNRFLLDF